MLTHKLKYLAVLAALWVVEAAAQDYPNKPLRMIVPFPAGGVTDVVARVVAAKLAAEMGQSVVVENRAGASGAIGAEAGAKALADGYTLVMGNISTLAINPVTFAKLAYDPITSFEPITMVAIQPLLIAVHPSVPAKSLGELVALAKNQPGALNYGTAGSSIHLAVEFFSHVAGIKMNHIPYKGSAPALTDLVGGQIQVLFDPFSSLQPHVLSGKVRALAVTTGKRSVNAPNLPTVGESGYSNFDVSSWQGIVVPAGTPKVVIQRLHRDLMKVLTAPDIKERFAQYSVVTAPSTPEEFKAYISSEIARWQKVANEAGVKAE